MARRITSALLGSISFAALCAPAAAAGIETVVVTAEKRAEDVKQVPMAVTVLGEKQLERTISTNFADYINQVPGMSYSAAEPGHTSLILRGINAGGVGATVGTYLDETPYGSSSALANGTITTPNIDTFDIQRVEVLRGPQGTLYGSSTLGGLLKFVTNAPSTDGYDAKAELGGVDMSNGNSGWSVRGMLNVPLSDNAAFRISLYDDQTPGYIDDPGRGLKDINQSRSQGGRASLLFNLNESLSVRLSAIVQDLDVDGNNVEDLTIVGGSYMPAFGKYQEQRVTNESSRVAYRVYNGTINWDLGWGSLTSTTSHDTFRDNLMTDATAVYGAFVQGQLRQQKFTQELRLVSTPNDGPFEWLVGGYYTHESALLHQDLEGVPFGASLLAVELPSKYIETAGFGALTYHFDPMFDLQLGGRYSHNSQSAFETVGGALVAVAAPSSGNVFTWSVAPRVHLDDDTLIYGRVAKGFRPGGPNALPPVPHPGVPDSYAADSLINYELGVKTDLLDGSLSLDADVFLIDWSDIQLLVVSGGFGVNTNGGTARSQGFEWNIDWRPLDQLTLRFNGAYTDAHLTSGTDPLLVGASSGARLPYTPRWGTSFDADYTFDTMGDVTPFIGASWRYVGERDSGFSPPAVLGEPDQFRLGAYNTLDVRVGADWEKWTVELYGKNLGNAAGITVFSATGASIASFDAVRGTPNGSAALTAPREFGIVLRAHL